MEPLSKTCPHTSKKQGKDKAEYGGHMFHMGKYSTKQEGNWESGNDLPIQTSIG